MELAKTNQSLTIAEKMGNHTKVMMQPYANWEEYLTPVPLSIAIMGELVFISSKTDFSINKNPPKDGYKYIRYPESFRACLMQVCNSGWGAFNEAHKNMDQIRLHTMAVPDYMKTAMKILFQDNDEVVKAYLPAQLENIRVIADDCLQLANATEQKFTDVINIIQELLEACVNAEYFYGKELDAIKKTLEETKLRKQSSEYVAEHLEQTMKKMEEQLNQAHESYNKAMNSQGRRGFFKKIFSSKSNDRTRVKQSRIYLQKTQEDYVQSVENMEKNQQELTEILITMRSCQTREIDFTTTIEMLVKGMDAMGRVKEQWEKMVRFFQMVSNIVKTSLTRTLKDFVSTAEETQKLPDNAKLFSKDLLYNQTFQATNIANLVNMISGTYTEVSTKHIMNHVSSLGKLMAMDKEKPEFETQREQLRESCEEAQRAILELVLKNKEEFEKEIVARLESIDQELLAILPADDAEEELST